MISVCLASYNGEKYIRAQIQSILSQLNTDDELIISDNYSTDSTLEIIESFNDSRIKVVMCNRPERKLRSKIQKDKNITNNFENALRACKGDYIFLSDQDDIWFDKKIDKQKPLLDKYELVMSNATIIDSLGNIVKEKLYEKNPLRKGLFSFRARGCLYSFRRELLDIALPIPKTVFSHDLWLIILAEYRKSFLFFDEPLVYHRRGIGNASTDVTEKSKNKLWFKIYYRIELLFDGFIRIINRSMK